MGSEVGHKSSSQTILDSAKQALKGREESKGKPIHIATRSLRNKVRNPLPELEDGSIVAEFDILLTPKQKEEQEAAKNAKGHLRNKRKAVRNSKYHWDDGIIHYVINRNVAYASRRAHSIIKRAMAYWESKTCLEFKEYNKHLHGYKDVLEFRKGSWCASKLGRIGGIQPLYIARGCLSLGTIIHELGHTIGWIHEQARPDRDRYIRVDWSRVPRGYIEQYEKQSSDFINTYGVPYDYTSIMHYPSSGELITLDRRYQHTIGQREKLSFYDTKLANIMYDCAAKLKCSRAITCSDDGYIGPGCKCYCKSGDSTCTRTKAVESKTTEKPKETRPETPQNFCGWLIFKNSFIRGMNNKQYNGVSLAQCQRLCEKEKSFTCQSIDYWSEKSRCFLSTKSVDDVGALASDKRMVHHQRKKCDKRWR